MEPRRFVLTAAWMSLAGAVLSGPVGVGLVQATHPQPPWQGPEVFAASYHPIQIFPYLMGFLLVGGCAGLVAGLSRLAPPSASSRSALAVVFAGAFVAMILINYAAQSTVVPGLVASSSPSSGPALTLIAMANPTSLAWGLEMWGYAALGLATWLLAVCFGPSGMERWTARLYALNGPASILAAAMTVVRPGWVMEPSGLVAFAAWNTLIMVMLVLTIAVMRRRMRASPVPSISRV